MLVGRDMIVAIGILVAAAVIAGGYFTYDAVMSGDDVEGPVYNSEPTYPRSGTFDLYFTSIEGSLGATDVQWMTEMHPSDSEQAEHKLGLRSNAVTWALGATLAQPIEVSDTVVVGIYYTSLSIGNTLTATLYDISPSGEMRELGSAEEDISLTISNPAKLTFEIDAKGQVIEEGHTIGLSIERGGIGTAKIVYDSHAYPSGVERLAWYLVEE